MGDAAEKKPAYTLTVDELEALMERAAARALAANTNADPRTKHAYLSPSEAATLLRKNTRTLTNMCVRGEVKARKVGREWRIPATEIDRLLGEE